MRVDQSLTALPTPANDADASSRTKSQARQPEVAAQKPGDVFGATALSDGAQSTSRSKRAADTSQGLVAAPANSAALVNTSLADYVGGLGNLQSLQPQTPYDYAHQVLKEEVPKRWGVTVDPNRIVYVRDETRITNATYDNFDGTGSQRTLYPGPTLTQAMVENRQDLRNYTLLGHDPERITHWFREVGADGRISDQPLNIPVSEFKDFVWNTNFAQSYENQVHDAFAKNRPVMETVTRASMLHEAERMGQGVVGENAELATDARDIVFAAAGLDPKSNDWSSLTREQLSQPRTPLPGTSVRPLTIAGKESTDILVMHRQDSQTSVLYSPGKALQVFPNQAALVGYLAQSAKDPKQREALASHFAVIDRTDGNGSETVDSALERLGKQGRDMPAGRLNPGGQEWERNYQTVGLGQSITGDVGANMTDRLENRFQSDGKTLITSDADHTRNRANQIWNKIRKNALPIVTMAASIVPGGQILGPLVGGLAGLVTAGIGTAKALNGKTSAERKEGLGDVIEGAEDIALSVQPGMRLKGAPANPGVAKSASLDTIEQGAKASALAGKTAKAAVRDMELNAGAGARGSTPNIAQRYETVRMALEQSAQRSAAGRARYADYSAGRNHPESVSLPFDPKSKSVSELQAEFVAGQSTGKLAPSQLGALFTYIENKQFDDGIARTLRNTGKIVEDWRTSSASDINPVPQEFVLPLAGAPEAGRCLPLTRSMAVALDRGHATPFSGRLFTAAAEKQGGKVAGQGAHPLAQSLRDFHSSMEAQSSGALKSMREGVNIDETAKLLSSSPGKVFYEIRTSNHAMLVSSEAAANGNRSYAFYDPNFGIARFNSVKNFRGALRQHFVGRKLGDVYGMSGKSSNPTFNLQEIDVSRMRDVEITPGYTVGNLVSG